MVRPGPGLFELTGKGEKGRLVPETGDYLNPYRYPICRPMQRKAGRRLPGHVPDWREWDEHECAISCLAEQGPIPEIATDTKAGR